jgi:2-methylisocitrate lyase-like PEP mutase family enzyme
VKVAQRDKAESFRKLHHGKRVLVLPNAWDVASARVFEDAGFPAIATSSAGMMVSLGFPDGEIMGRDLLIPAIKRIADSLSVPLSADVVTGYGKSPKEVASSVQQIINAGAIGINIEDFDPATKELYPLGGQLAKLKALKALAGSLRLPFVINARTDALRYAPGDANAKMKEAIKRGIAFRDIGVDCVYPMGLTDAVSISRYVDALRFPVNVMVRKGLPPVKELQRLGVARVSFGPSASYAAMGLLKRASAEVLEKGTYNHLVRGAITFDELNALASPNARR